MPTVSAIIPIYNPRPDYLDEALSSIASQSFDDIETVVVNDGSTDKSFEAVLRKHASLIKYIEQNNRGVAGARNTGVAAAGGRYVAFLDQDDRWHPDKLKKQVMVLENDPAVDVVFHSINYIDGDGRAKKPNRSQRRRFEHGLRATDIVSELLKGNFVYSATVLAKRECFAGIGGFDPAVDPHDDWDMWLRLAIAGFKFRGIDENLADWRVHPGNTSRDLDRMLRTRRAVIEKIANSELPRESWRRQLNRMRARYHITVAHSLYKKRQYRKFREEVRTAFKMHWPSALDHKTLRRWCRSVVVERARPR